MKLSLVTYFSGSDTKLDQIYMKHEDEVFELKELQVESLKAAQIDKEVLISIFRDYTSNQEVLAEQARYLGNILQHGDGINSVKQRIKDPLRLLTKIVRKRKEAVEGSGDAKYLNISVDNYKSIVNDLVGIRAIYLFKENWEWVNDFTLDNFIVCKDEAITIYHAVDDDLSLYPENNTMNKGYKYKLSTKPCGYRSTHYIIKGIPPYDFKFELQTRTILDEAWGEIDHHIRYPDFQHDSELERKMSILNGALSACGELTSTFFNHFNELRVKTDEKFTAVDDTDITLMPREEAIELIAHTAKVSDGTWDRIILNAALSREKERVTKSQEIIKNKIASEKVNNQKRHLENISLHGEIKTLEDKPVNKKQTASSKSIQKSLRIAEYKKILKGVSDEVFDSESESK